MLARYGRFVHRHRWAMPLASAGLLALSIRGAALGASPHLNGAPADTESGAAPPPVTTPLPPRSDPPLAPLSSRCSLPAAGPSVRARAHAAARLAHAAL